MVFKVGTSLGPITRVFMSPDKARHSHSGVNSSVGDRTVMTMCA